ncbi:DNA topoisomerase IV subunit A [Candidatus Xianfuyuplasma coldseepsis]|uniref:DNA topoisomerase (ATP-hydrolyzing) n=1 Tax=Candidatus Xianfuyuplasma coldseepsis TaxID=2782163 RepID=A0A7L7KVW6_9MOLU|nr:DNA topoisomerase IV subunit A [Xianfuyuplasma coldseepsis]QMS85898.1 DNA topoisomerase IV subunit A [Xianfuyuplasma coldseepsis]
MAKKTVDLISEFVDQKIIEENLESIVGERFGRYSKYIIQDRALPDVRDGLKPVQRRVLYSMFKLGMFSDKPYKKSARIVGDVIGKYHPHGDTSVYDAMVRLSQTWKMLTPLVDMHGNNGSIDGDSSAAMRYTEARMSAASEILLQDIEKRTVDFVPNFDDEEYEPTVLPSRYPNLLCNGATGISAGYATEIPPHNLREVINAVVKRIEKPDITIDDVIKIMRGPDFPTGAIVQGKDEIRKAFETGRGRIIIRSRTMIENQQIIVTEIPYEVNKAALVRKIDDIRIKKQIDGIDEVRDESDREGLRIVVDVKKGFDPQVIESFLLKKTNLTKSYNYNMVAINNKRPMLMGVLQIIDAYILHQKEVITNRSNYDLRRAEKRLHVVDGIIKMMDVLDEVIVLIRASKNKKDAKTKLSKAFKFSEEQAEAIVTLQLYRLSSTDIKSLQEEMRSLQETIAELQLILNNETELERVIVDELRTIQRKLATKRLTDIEEEIEKITISEEELIAEEQVVVGITKEGYIKSTSIRSYRATEEVTLRDNDSMIFVDEVSTLNTILMFTNKGNYVYLPVYKIPSYKWRDLGTHINNIVQLEEDEFIIKVLRINDFSEPKSLLFVTKKNLIKQTALADFDVSRYTKTIRAIALNKGDEVVAIDITDNPDAEVIIFSQRGEALRFNLNEIPLTSTTAKGVKGMNLSSKQHLASGIVLKNHHDLLVLSNRGHIKRIGVTEIPKKRRTNKGVQMYKIVRSNPHLVQDTCIMNATQYKNRVIIRINTTTQEVLVNAFDVKYEKSENGKQFVRPKKGTPLFMDIEQVEEDPSITPLSDYVREEDHEIVQQQLFE